MPAISGSSRSPDETADGFASTEWSLVLAASVNGGPALDRLCRAYWRPVYVYIRATGLPRSEAEDAAQEFFADMLRRDWLKLVDRERGSFRAFLRTSVKFFLNNRRRESQAQKRGGGQVAIPLDAEECEREIARYTDPSADPAMLYERSWAKCVVDAALARVAAEQTSAGNAERFAKLRPFLMTTPRPGEYGRIAAELGIASAQVAVLVHRLSRRFGEVIRAEVAATLVNRSDIEGELRELMRLVAQHA